MNNRNNSEKFNLMRLIKKIFLSAFVVFSFIAYALHKPDTGNSASVGLAAQQSNGTVPSQASTSNNAAQNAPAENATPTNPPAPTAPAAPATANAPQQIVIPSPTPALPTAVPPTNVPPTATNPNIVLQNGQFKDGTYTGPVVDAFYGLVQVQAVVQNGKIENVQFLQFPNDRRTSVRINSFAVPRLQQEAVQAQSANVNLISGATLTSEAFQMSLQYALNQAKG